MSDFKNQYGVDPQVVPDAVSVQTDSDKENREPSRLPVGTYDDYKSWCEKVRQEWDVN